MAIIEVSEVVEDSSGTNRLVCRMIECDYQPVSGQMRRNSESAWQPIPPGTGKFHDFHSLAWEVKAGGGWEAHLVISNDKFSPAAARRRWVNKLHSFDSLRGVAVIQIGEEQPRDPDGIMRVRYSWQEWSLVKNQQIRELKACKSPFDAPPTDC